MTWWVSSQSQRKFCFVLFYIFSALSLQFTSRITRVKLLNRYFSLLLCVDKDNPYLIQELWRLHVIMYAKHLELKWEVPDKCQLLLLLCPRSVRWLWTQQWLQCLTLRHDFEVCGRSLGIEFREAGRVLISGLTNLDKSWCFFEPYLHLCNKSKEMGAVRGTGETYQPEI